MRPFKHYNADSLGGACKILNEYEGRAMIIAGGTDLVTVLKGDILAQPPEAVVNIKTIPGLDYIREENGFLRIGALTLLADIADSKLLRENYSALAQAADKVASPQIRNVGTLGGNLCQDTRCWYYRYPERLGGIIICPRKGGGYCMAVKGDNRYHAVIGAKKCFAVCPSDTAVALMALDARLVISDGRNERKVPISEFYHPLGNVLAKNELVREIELPAAKPGTGQSFMKFTMRKPIDFALVSAAAFVAMNHGVCTEARISVGAVAPGPYRPGGAEKMLVGGSVTAETAAAAAEAALSGARPLKQNEYKIQIAKALIKRTLLTAARRS